MIVKRVFLIVLFLFMINISYAELSLKINAQLGGYNTDFYLKSADNATREYDIYDMPLWSVPSNYSYLVSNASNNLLVIDYWNSSDLPRTIPLKYVISQGHAGTLTFSWTYSGSYDLTLLDYGTSAYTTQIASKDMASVSSYSKDLTGSEQTIYLQVLVGDYTPDTSSSSSSSSSGGGGSGGGSVGGGSLIRNRIVSLEIIPTTDLRMYSNDSLSAKIRVVNTGDLDFESIDMSMSSPSKDISATPSNVVINGLDVNKSYTFNLDIKSHTDPGTYQIDIRATSDNPRYSTTTKLFVDILDIRGDINNLYILERLNFAYDLFNKNPECLEYIEVLDQAKEALDKNETDKAISLTESAINACKQTMSSLSKPRLSARNQQSLSVIIVISVILITTFLIWTMMERWRGRKKILKGITKKKAKEQKEEKPKKDIWKK